MRVYTTLHCIGTAEETGIASEYDCDVDLNTVSHYYPSDKPEVTNVYFDNGDMASVCMPIEDFRSMLRLKQSQFTWVWYNG